MFPGVFLMIEVVFLRKWPFATAPPSRSAPEARRDPGSLKVTACKPEGWETGRTLSMSGGQTHHHTITAAHAAGKVHLCLPLFLSLCLFLFLSLCSFSISYSISFSFLLPVCFRLLPFAFVCFQFAFEPLFPEMRGASQGSLGARPFFPPAASSVHKTPKKIRMEGRFAVFPEPPTRSRQGKKSAAGNIQGIFKEFCAGSAASP